ncbi:MAG: glycoside hydrolase family 2 [Akkermansiaceae bacterium]|nr:glycoside hydrolase family 2 [Akkermansiaceae bacterium]
MTTNNDFFADLTSQDKQVITEGLYEPQPPELDHHVLERHASPVAAPEFNTITDEAGLKQALKSLREKMRGFLINHAPLLDPTRKVQELGEFDWRMETAADQSDFTGQVIQGGGEWEKVTIPHYGGPQGVATAFYRTTVEFSAADLSLGSTFICFKGVDYKAHVYVNGACVGSHEGFFAPFEFDISKWAVEGGNTIVVRVDNDAICMSNKPWGKPDWEGDKIYGATGPGWDDSSGGWCHCPPGMGLYQDVCIEHRPSLFLHDLYVRPMPDRQSIEIWVEVYNTTPLPIKAGIAYAVHGRNFKQDAVLEGRYVPTTKKIPGFGDMVKPDDHKEMRLFCGSGVNYFKIRETIRDARVWSMDEPWLYQLQASLVTDDGAVVDTKEQHFGIRSFRSDEENVPKGRMFFNDEEIRLRGANTMGHMQQCVINKNWEQLIDDVLLAKLCNLNFFRMTQRPVQPEIYDHFDMLGILSQSDFPMFGCLRRNQFDEALRQAREMERLLRSHPSCVIISYMNEPFPNGDSKPHRNLDFEEQRAWYAMADTVVRQANPDRVIKAVDGDYDPPSPGIADRHCYNLWYGNHGIDFGKFHRGYWQVSKTDWYHGCGEFGVEALDSVEVMRQHYPAEWMTARDAEGHWLPDPIPYNQTYKFHHLWYETPRGGIDAWVEKSHAFQGYALRHMVEAFRRDNDCVTCAVHLFIDAFPSGWMKTIMDVHRKPKAGYFALREALAPLAVSLRTDRFSGYAGESMAIEAWLSNDGHHCPADYRLHYQIEDASGNLIASGGAAASIKPCRALYQGDVQVEIPSSISGREKLCVTLTLVDGNGGAVHRCQQSLLVFPRPNLEKLSGYCGGTANRGEAARVLKNLGAAVTDTLAAADVTVIDDMAVYDDQRQDLLAAVENGGLLVLLSPPPGVYQIGSAELEIVPTGMCERHFASRDTGHPIVSQLGENDLRFWHDEDAGYITPFFRTCILPNDDMQPVLTSGTGGSGFGGPDEWTPVVVAGEISHGSGCIRICQLDLGNRINTNGAAGVLAASLLTPNPVSEALTVDSLNSAG